MEELKKYYTLNDGQKIPCIAYGTYAAAEQDGAATLRLAIEAGYRYFDTASFYGTETYLAEAVRDSGLPRSEFIIATKAWKTELGYENIKAACKQSLEKLGTDYVDLYLLHWPSPSADYEDWKQLDLESWRAMEELCREGKAKSIGVSNFMPHHLDNIWQHISLASCKSD